MTKKKQILLIIPMITLFTFLLFPHIQLVSAADLSTSDIDANPTTVNSLSNSTITVTVQGTGGTVEGASVGIHVEGGLFPGGTNIHNDTSDSNGQVIVEWQAPLVDYDILYNFTATIKMESSVNVTRTTQVTVQPLDLSGTTLEANPSIVNENSSSNILVTVQGSAGVIPDADVTITGVGGEFSSTSTDISTGTTNASGEYTDIWEAPNPPVETNYTLELTVTYDGTNATFVGEYNITVVPVEGQLYLDLNVIPGYELDLGEIATIEVTVKENITNTVIENAFVVFDALDGNFTENGLDLYSGTTDVTGKITVHWETETVNPGMFGTDYTIDITVSKISYQTNYTTLEFFVEEEIEDLVVNITSNTNAITLGESVEITVTVKLGSTAYEDAYVSVVAFSGNFTGANGATINGYTDSNGNFTVTWDTSEMVMTGSDPINYTFSITIDVFPYYLDQSYSYNITVTPTETSTTPGGNNLGEFYTQWWFFVAIGGGIIGVGTIIILLTRKKA